MLIPKRYEYSAYGQRTVYFSPGSNDPFCMAPTVASQRFVASTGTEAYGLCEFGHQGLMHDEESGLVYDRDRYLAPALGRFLQTDPARYLDSNNLYQYVRTSPTRYSDPTGNMTVRVWNPGKDSSGADEVGHVSLQLCDGTYVSWWPKGEDKKLKTNIFGTPGINHGSVGQDSAAEGHDPDKTVEISCKCYDENAMKKWFDDNYLNNPNATWSAVNDSCAGVVKGAINKGISFWNPEYNNFTDTHPTSWTPEDVGQFADDLKTWCDSKSKGFCHAAVRYEWEYTKEAVGMPYNLGRATWHKAKSLWYGF